MTYKINGVELDNKAEGWSFLRGSIPASGLEYSSTALDIPGKDGTVFLPSTRRPVTFTFIIKSKFTGRNKLLMLLSSPKLTITNDDRPGLVAEGRLLSSSVDEFHEAKGWAKDTFIIEIPQGCWRGPTATSTPTPLTAGGTTHNAFTDLSAPVQDGLVKITGPVQNPQVVDQGSGSFFKLTGTVPSGSTLEYNLATGRAHVRTGGSTTEVSGHIDFGGPRGSFELTPYQLTGTARVVVTTTTYNTGSSVSVVAQPAYLF